MEFLTAEIKNIFEDMASTNISMVKSKGSFFAIDN